MFEKIFPKITKGIIIGVLASIEGQIMLPIALALDVTGIILFILSLAGIGIPVSFLVDLIGMIVMNIWMVTKIISRSFTEYIGSNIGSETSRSLNQFVGNPEESAPMLSQAKSSGESFYNLLSKSLKMGGGILFSVLRFLIVFLIEMIPFAGDLLPGWTFFVFWQVAEDILLGII